MITTSPTPRGTRSATRPLLAVTALSALLVLSACGSSDDPPSENSSGSAAPSSSTSPSSASPSAADASGSASPTPSSSEQTAQAAEASQSEPEETRRASAPEVGMPTASPFDQQKADAQAGAGTCAAGQLSGSTAPQQGAAGHVIASVTLTNTGSTPCTLSGYPGVSFVNASGAAVGAPASREETGGAGAVVLQPGASATSSLQITQPGVVGQVCNPQDVTGLRVYPPGSYDSLVLSYPGQACGNPKVSQLQVRAFGS